MFCVLWCVMLRCNFGQDVLNPEGVYVTRPDNESSSVACYLSGLKCVCWLVVQLGQTRHGKAVPCRTVDVYRSRWCRFFFGSRGVHRVREKKLQSWRRDGETVPDADSEEGTTQLFASVCRLAQKGNFRWTLRESLRLE